MRIVVSSADGAICADPRRDRVRHARRVGMQRARPSAVRPPHAPAGGVRGVDDSTVGYQ